MDTDRRLDQAMELFWQKGTPYLDELGHLFRGALINARRREEGPQEVLVAQPVRSRTQATQTADPLTVDSALFSAGSLHWVLAWLTGRA
jgi:hypothetical protein